MLGVELTTEFWFGTAILLAYQTAKFNELSGLDPIVTARLRWVPKLSTRNFVDRVPFLVTLAIFLVVSFLIYAALCGVSPRVLMGWTKITGSEIDIAEIVKTVPYPLYIVAAFIGLTQQAIPGLSKIGEIQRDYFHYWIGVPRRVVETSNSFVTELQVKNPTGAQLWAVLEKLVSAEWRSRIDGYADTLFYKAQVVRLELDNETVLDDVKSGSLREKRNLIEQLVDAAALATVRQGGGRALPQLAKDLGVTMPPHGGRQLRRLVVGVVLYVPGLILLWFLLPMLQPAVAALFGQKQLIFWPTEPEYSGQYLMANVVPIFIALVTALILAPSVAKLREVSDAGKGFSLMSMLDRYGWALFGAAIVVLTFDFAQGLFDYGYFKKSYEGTIGGFVGDNVPFYALHSLIALTVCYNSLRYYTRRMLRQDDGRAAAIWLKMIVSVALISAFYAEARLFYQYENVAAPDYITLVVLLNIVGGLLAFATVRSFCQRKQEEEQSAPPATPLPATQSQPIT